MSISGISSSSNAYPTSAAQNRIQFRTDFNDLAQALGAGDLSGAQSAFAALQQLQPARFASSTTPSGTQNVDAANPIGADIAALGKALQSGDLNSAQDAFKKLQQDMGSVHHGHHHHHKQAGGAQSAPSSADGNSTNDPFGNDPSSGGQVGVTA